jgi:hypothetical protein
MRLLHLICISLFLLATPAMAQSVIQVEADTGTLTDGAVVDTAVPGYTGTGYVDGFTTGHGLDSMTFSVPQAGDYDLWVGYYTPFGFKECNVTVNGSTIAAPLNAVTIWSSTDVGRFAFAAGSNTVAIGGNWGWYDIDYIELNPVIHLEAENGTLAGGVSVSTAEPGYSGAGYVTGFTATSGSVTFSNVQALAGSYEVLVRYLSPSPETYSLTVNGSQTTQSCGPAAGFYTADGGSVTLTGAANTIVITGGSGGYSIDYIELWPIVKMEAESGVLSGYATVQRDPTASGGEYVQVQNATETVGTNTVNSGTTLSPLVPGGIYDIQIGYESPFGYKGVDIIADAFSTSSTFTSTTWSTVDAGRVLLTGTNDSVFLGSGWGWYDIDYIELVPAAPEPAPLPVPDELSDPKATPQAHQLFDYLLSNYGSDEMISGQHDLSELPYIQQYAGVQPALTGVDLIDFSPSRTYYQGPPSPDPTTAMIGQERANGNIVTAMWHWNAPTDLINSAGEPWWSGFYTVATTFDIKTALADPTSNDYKLLLSNMDVIAAQLQKFSDAQIPVLWRPFHEASGEWFWWGAKGPGPFIKIWRIMYDRFTGPIWHLHNLIWVFSGSDPSWYPGDKYVDVVGADLYTTENDPTDGSWDTYKQAFDGDKLIALTEFGGVPNASMMHEFGVDWSYFMTWPGFEEEMPVSEFSQFYNSPELIDQSELPAWDWVNPQLPVTTTSLSGPQNNNSNGWYCGDVSVTLSATGANPIAKTFYTLAGVEHVYKQTFEVDGDGEHVLQFWSVDVKGNVEQTKTITVMIDATPPTVTFGKPSSAPNANGWNRSTVTMPYSPADATSGAQTLATKNFLTFSSEGAGQTQSITIADIANNSATFTSPPVNIDLTPPQTTATVSGVKVTLTATDNLSGVAHTYYTIDSGVMHTYAAPFKVTPAGANTVAYWSVDMAGNVEGRQTVSVTAP